MKTNTHGYTMHGLRKAASETKNLPNYYHSGEYIQINYNRATGNILTNYHCDITETWQTIYSDPDIIDVCNASVPMTMQEIADAVAAAIAHSAIK